MKIAHERLIFLALAVVTEASEACEPAPIKPTLGLRLALAFLWEHSKDTRDIYDEFWRVIQQPGLPGQHEEQRSYIRSMNATSCLRRMIRTAGMPETVEFDSKLRALCGPTGRVARYSAAQALKQASRETEREKERIRRARECDLSE